MKISRKPTRIVIEQLDDFLVELMRRIPSSAKPGGNQAAKERIFSKPESVEGKLSDDWKLYVEPELQYLFQTALEVVDGDLKKVKRKKQENGEFISSLSFSPEHIEAWLSATNQARLVLSEVYNFREAELSGEIPEAINNEKDLALFQVHFYGFIQECFLRILE